MKILITGNAGLLGSNFTSWLKNNTDHDLIGIDDLSGAYEDYLPDGCTNYNFNLTDLDKLKEVFKTESPDIVYHFAAYAAEGLSPFIRKFNYENNLIASTNLITCSIESDVKRFVFASSMSVYGNIHTPPFTEEMLPCPIDPYAIAKYAVEQDLKVAHDQHSLNYTIIRPHNFYGKNQNIWDKYRNVLGIWMYQIINNNRPTVFGDGLQKRAFSYIDDAMKPLWVASQNDECIGEIINLGGIQEHSVIDACNELIKVVGDDSIQPLHLEPRHETKYAFSTWEKSEKLLGFKHLINLDVGLDKMWKWAQLQPNRDRFFWDKYELDKGIYDYWKTEERSRTQKKMSKG